VQHLGKRGREQQSNKQTKPNSQKVRVLEGNNKNNTWHNSSILIKNLAKDTNTPLTMDTINITNVLPKHTDFNTNEQVSKPNLFIGNKEEKYYNSLLKLTSPQKGQVIAFKLLQLTGYTPEISAWQEAVIVDVQEKVNLVIRPNVTATDQLEQTVTFSSMIDPRYIDGPLSTEAKSLEMISPKTISNKSIPATAESSEVNPAQSQTDKSKNKGRRRIGGLSRILTMLNQNTSDTNNQIDQNPK